MTTSASQWVLLLWIGFAADDHTVTSTSMMAHDFNSERACQHAGEEAYAQFRAAQFVTWFCTEKGAVNDRRVSRQK